MAAPKETRAADVADHDSASVPFGEGDFVLSKDENKSEEYFKEHGSRSQVDTSNYGKFLGVLGTRHFKCMSRMSHSCSFNPHVKLLLEALKENGCEAFQDRHFSCEQCSTVVSGGFDSESSQIVLCQNNIQTQAGMDRVLTHELIHAFDHCRAKVNWNDVRHLACSEIRAANLSGECSFVMEHVGRFHRMQYGFMKHHQTCVKDRAIRSVLAAREVPRPVVEKAVDEVFDSCFNDHEPFHKIPRNKSDAKAAFRERYQYDL
ncbi:mitochondrial inner membrane protease ATP23 homolog [Ptychodera flava]|uniref:mitochondrial inner membrane protease ATP23 homolog n=1 Tax=Ptychodera flava TaxID=63121 RepID=UPI003969F637